MSMPPGITVSLVRSYVTSGVPASIRAILDPSMTMLVLWKVPPLPSIAVPTRRTMG